MLMDHGVKMEELEEALYHMTYEELMEEALKAMEYVTIYRRAFDAAKKIVKLKSQKKLYIPKDRINLLDIPAIVCTYDQNQCDEVENLKADLGKMAYRLKYIYEEEYGFRHRKDNRFRGIDLVELEENDERWK